MKYEVKITETKTYYVDVEALNIQGAKALGLREFKKGKELLLYNAERLVEVEKKNEEAEDRYTIDDLGNNWY